ncbi:hypothetical protein OL548_33885 (plasmid) [Lysinibacillus sp. MHQ-1]|nr:hypothetical protein OL548_33885 [Lysinibacillus sp. MHQ-1]
MDFGVDLRLELLLEENNASNFKIDVQMKNVKKGKKDSIMMVHTLIK